MRTSLSALAILAASLPVANNAPAADSNGITEYQAVYDISYGNFSGTGEFSVSADADGEYLFESSIRLQGLLVRMLVGSNPAIERTRFVVADGQIRSVHFIYEDGTRKGEDNLEIAFDAPGNEIRVKGPAGSRTMAYEPDLLDRGALHIATMRDLAACIAPGPYRYVDADGITTYQYERLDDRSTETGIGTLTTVRFSQQREGSGRMTILWLAPEYAYMPVRIERFNHGELEWNFSLARLDGIERGEAPCSGFR